MQAETQPGSFSTINVKFGEFSVNTPPEATLKLTIDYCSQKTNNKRFNIGEYVNKEISNNTVVIEIQAKGDAQDLAKALKEVCKNSQSIKELEENIKIEIIGKGTVVYVLLVSEMFQGMIQTLNKQVENTSGLNNQDEVWLELNMNTNNKFSKLKQLIYSRKNGLAGVFDSLNLNIKFNQTKNIRELVKFLIDNIAKVPNGSSVFQSFDCVNLDIQLESSSFLENYPIVFEKLKMKELLPFNEDFKAVQSQLGNKLNIYAFGEPLSLTAELKAEDLHLALDLFFS